VPGVSSRVTGNYGGSAGLSIAPAFSQMNVQLPDWNSRGVPALNRFCRKSFWKASSNGWLTSGEAEAILIRA